MDDLLFMGGDVDLGLFVGVPDFLLSGRRNSLWLDDKLFVVLLPMEVSGELTLESDEV